MPSWFWAVIVVIVVLVVVGYLAFVVYGIVRATPVGTFLVVAIVGLAVAAGVTGIWWLALFAFPVLWLTMWLVPG